MRRKPDYGHLIVRKDHIACAVCGCAEPVHAGDGTPMPAFASALGMVMRRHPRRKTVRVAGLVTAAFIGPRPSGRQVNHKNGVKADIWSIINGVTWRHVGREE